MSGEVRQLNPVDRTLSTLTRSKNMARFANQLFMAAFVAFFCLGQRVECRRGGSRAFANFAVTGGHRRQQ